MILGDVESSYRKTTKLINIVRYQEVGGTPYRTLQDNTEKEGARVIDYLEKKTNDVCNRSRLI